MILHKQATRWCVTLPSLTKLQQASRIVSQFSCRDLLFFCAFCQVSSDVCLQVLITSNQPILSLRKLIHQLVVITPINSIGSPDPLPPSLIQLLFACWCLQSIFKSGGALGDFEHDPILAWGGPCFGTRGPKEQCSTMQQIEKTVELASHNRDRAFLLLATFDPGADSPVSGVNNVASFSFLSVVCSDVWHNLCAHVSIPCYLLFCGKCIF
jgi:hypothetical protein